VPIYHPSPQVLASHRREAEQLQDYKVVAQAIKAGAHMERGQPILQCAASSAPWSEPGP
jgi:hypothetical protein